MKISSQTLSFLKSFASINSNLIVRKGNALATRNSNGSIQARAVVDEEFPRQFAIYDLNQLLGLISVSGDPDIEFAEDSLLIRSGGTIRYFYANESLIKAPPETELPVNVSFSCNLTAGDMSVIQKTSSIVSATTLELVGDGTYVTLKISDPKNDTSNSYSKVVGESELLFDMKLSIDNFRPIVDDAYVMNVGTVTSSDGRTKVKVFQFVSTNRSLRYLIAADTTSKL